jgi:hypothetical protein
VNAAIIPLNALALRDQNIDLPQLRDNLLRLVAAASTSETEVKPTPVQVPGGGAKKQRGEPSGRLQRQ